eukprot:4809926-Amphidinium_carterae.1
MEENEREGSEGFFLALDWSKTFDSVPHDALIDVSLSLPFPPPDVSFSSPLRVLFFCWCLELC